MIQPLDLSRTANFGAVDVNGHARASVTVGPDVIGANWRVKHMVTSASVATGVQVFLYAYHDSEAPTNLFDSSFAGIGDSSETDLMVQVGQRLQFIWLSQSDPGAGATATIRLMGDVDNQRR